MLEPPIQPPKGDPSTSSRIVDGMAPTGDPIVSVVFGMTYDVGPQGKLSPKGYTVVDELSFEKARVTTLHTRPSLLVRDADPYAWRNFTDVVVQGVARSDKAVSSLDVKLEVHGPKTKIEYTLCVTGDRWVDKGTSGLVLSSPVLFSEMPLRYDRAYGGTDEAAEEKLADEEELNFFVRSVEAEDNEELSEYSYPRNAAGKGYLVDADGAAGLPWPNLEFHSDRLKLERLVRPLDRWGERPFPACFDWFHHAWFPRCAFVVGVPPTHDDKLPELERRLGLFEPDFENKSIHERSMHPYANGAHPYLCRNRLEGDETLRVTHASRDGRDFVVVLPKLQPTTTLRFLGEAKLKVPASLDLVFVETELDQVTLVWRSTLVHKREHVPIDWIERSPYEVHL